TPDRVAGPGGLSRNLSRHRSAVMRRGDTTTGITSGNTTGRPTLITVKPQRPMLPESVAAAIAAMRNSAAWGDVAHRLSDTGIINTLSAGAGAKLEEAAAALARERVKPRQDEEAGSSEDEDEDDGEDDEERNMLSPDKQREMFVERWRTWFDDADNAPVSGLLPSYGATSTHSIELVPSPAAPPATRDGGGSGGGGGIRTLCDGETCSGLEDVAAVGGQQGARVAQGAEETGVRQQQSGMDRVQVRQARAGPRVVDVDVDLTVAAPAGEGSQRRPLGQVVIPALTAAMAFTPVAIGLSLSEVPATPNMGVEASRPNSSRRALQRACLIRDIASGPSQSSNRSHSSTRSNEGAEAVGCGRMADGGAVSNGSNAVSDGGRGEGGGRAGAFLAARAMAVSDSGKLGGLPRRRRHRHSVCLVDASTQVNSPPDTASVNLLASCAAAAGPSPGNAVAAAMTAADAGAAAAAMEARASGDHSKLYSTGGLLPLVPQNTCY
ncbi:hypothetical protein Vretifemale_5295, partial [Volvox reticuliferus]